jgi:hypothetical protein
MEGGIADWNSVPARFLQNEDVKIRSGYLLLDNPAMVVSCFNNAHLFTHCTMSTLPDVKSIAKQYVILSNAVDYNGMANLFAEEAQWVPIAPIEPRIGREAIRAGYLNHVKSKNRPIVNARYYADGLTCVVEFEVQLEEDQRAFIVDVFTFNEAGEIVRLAIYKR